jgi:hypothetical protein
VNAAIAVSACNFLRSNHLNKVGNNQYRTGGQASEIDTSVLIDESAGKFNTCVFMAPGNLQLAPFLYGQRAGSRSSWTEYVQGTSKTAAL